MAYVDQSQESPAAATPAGQQQAPVAAGGAGVAGSTKAAATQGMNVPAQPSAQLSAYLSANQPQATQFAGQVAQNVGQQVQAAGDAIQPAANTYTGNIYSVPTDQATNQAVSASPSSLTPQQQATYQAELGASAKAPNAANTFETTQGYQDVSQGIQNAVEQASLWNAGNNPASLTSALTPYEGANTTAGGTTLDALLLSQTPGAYSQIQQAVAPAAGFQGQLATATTGADQALQNAIAADTAATPAAQSAALQYVTNLNAYLNNALTQAQGQTNTYNAALNTLSQNENNIAPSIAALQQSIPALNKVVNQEAGVAAESGAPLAQIDAFPSSALPSIPAIATSPTLAQIATPTQYADLAALANDLGESGLNSLGPTISPSTAAQAGTFTAPGSVPLISPSLSQYLSQIKPELSQDAASWYGFTPPAAFSTVEQQVSALQQAINALAGA